MTDYTDTMTYYAPVAIFISLSVSYYQEVPADGQSIKQNGTVWAR